MSSKRHRTNRRSNRSKTTRVTSQLRDLVARRSDAEVQAENKNRLVNVNESQTMLGVSDNQHIEAALEVMPLQEEERSTGGRACTRAPLNRKIFQIEIPSEIFALSDEIKEDLYALIRQRNGVARQKLSTHAVSQFVEGKPQPGDLDLVALQEIADHVTCCIIGRLQP